MDRFEITSGRVLFFYTVIEQKRDPRRVSHAFLKQVLARCTNNRVEALRFTAGRDGKPSLAQGITDLPVCFNLSHTRDLVVCALTLGYDIGVDIEHMRRKVDLSIADRFFSNQEAHAISQADESYAKATGRGLAIGLDQFSFVLDRPDIQVRFHRSGPGQDHSGQWQFFQFSPVPEYMAAVAVNKKHSPPLSLSVHSWVRDDFGA